MQFVKQSLIRASPRLVFAFHEQPNVLTLLSPPWESARVVQSAKISEVGTQAIVETKILGRIKVRWVAEHTLYDPPIMFEDVQVKGPFRSWRHRHIVDACAAVARTVGTCACGCKIARGLSPILVR